MATEDDFDSLPDADEEFDSLPDVPAYDQNTGTGKVFVPSGNDGQGATETRRGFKLIGPSELGNTTGREPEANPSAPPKEPGFFSNLGHQALRGYFKGNSDELVGEFTEAAQGLPEARHLGRNIERRKLKAGEQAHPKSSFLANVAGDVASDLTAAAFGAPVLSRGYQTAMGALRGLGESEAELTPGRMTPADVEQASGDAFVGGMVGRYAPQVVAGAPAVARGVIGKAGELAERLPGAGRIASSEFAKRFRAGADALGEAASGVAQRAGDAIGAAVRWPGEALDRAAIATGRRVLTDGQGGLSGTAALADDAVREAMDSGAIVPFGTTRGASNRLTAVRDQVGDEYGRIIRELEERGVQGPRAQELADQWMERYRQEWSRSQANKGVPDAFRDEAANVVDITRPAPGLEGPAAPRLGLSQAEGLKRGLQRQAKYGKYEETPLNEARREIAGGVRGAIEGEVDRAAATTTDPQLRALATQFAPVRDRLARLIPADDASFRGAEQASKRNALSLRDTILMSGGLSGVGGAALGTKGAVAPLALGAASYLARTRGPSTFAWGSRGAARLYLDAIDNAPWLFGDVGAAVARETTPEARLAVTQALADTSPQFAEMLEDFKQRTASREAPSEPEASRGF